jgi:hypothetical protein
MYVIPKNNSFIKRWKNDYCYEICGDKLYELVTGSKTSYIELIDALNNLI